MSFVSFLNHYHRPLLGTTSAEPAGYNLLLHRRQKLSGRICRVERKRGGAREGRTMTTCDEEYDRVKEVKQFDESKMGVKGLIDSGITSIPRFFVHPPESHPRTATNPDENLVPVVDLSGATSDRRPLIVDEIRRAFRNPGLFQVINHGIPCDVLNRTTSAIRAFHEQPSEIKSQYYSRERRRVTYFSNIDLFNSKAASWRDTLQVGLAPPPLEPEELPEICRREVVEWDREVMKFLGLLTELMSEGLGLESGRLKGLTCLESRVMVGHYYPYCPEPDLTVGITSHADPGVMTVVLQDQPGLQVKCGEDWVDVKAIPGALCINAGDILQIISNDEYKSVQHRVLANPLREPRTSVGIFFNPGKRDELYGPLPELISPEKPAVYRSFLLSDFMQRFFTKDLGGKSLLGYYKI